VIMTATELDNFFELRDHPDAQPEIHELARQMREAVNGYSYDKLKIDEWHLPYVKSLEKEKFSLYKCIQISVARCARVSYLTHDGQISKPDDDVKLYERLVGSKPLHASPAEHQASPLMDMQNNPFAKYQGNFFGWMQFRKILEDKMNGYNNKAITTIFNFNR
jgi:thymidylate synthase ThyX